MSDLLPISAGIKADIKADLTHAVDKVTDLVTEPCSEACTGLRKILLALVGPWIALREGQRKCIETQYEKLSLEILANRKEWDFKNKKAIPSSNAMTVEELCRELVQADSSCKAKRLEAAILDAAKEIKRSYEAEISDEPLNQTFFNHWKEEAELIDDEDLRLLWAKLLAEETRKPNSVSPRTLEVVRLLSKSDAVIFEKLGMCIVGDCIVVNSEDCPLNGEYQDLLTLQDAGLIGQKSSRWYNAVINDTAIIPLPTSNFILAASCKKIRFSCHILTQAGKQLLKFLNRTDDIRYFQMAAREISKQNSCACLSICPVLNGEICLNGAGIWSTDFEKE